MKHRKNQIWFLNHIWFKMREREGEIFRFQIWDCELLNIESESRAHRACRIAHSVMEEWEDELGMRPPASPSCRL